MTTKIDISAAQFAENTTFQTNDGKTIKVKHFCVEEPEPEAPKHKKAWLSRLQLGQKVRTERGDVLSLESVDGEALWPYVFVRENGIRLSYTSEGWYWWNESTPNEHDIVEILPYEVLLVPLGDLPIGSTFRTRSGLVCTLEKSNISKFGPLFGRQIGGGGGKHYDLDGSCREGNVHDAVEILTRGKPRISIEDASKGNTFVLRNGKEYVFTGERSFVNDKGYKNLMASRAGGRGSDCLWFQPDGVCPNRDEGYEVVELIPAPKAPRVSIERATKGDTFVLRNGRRLKVSEIRDLASIREGQALARAEDDLGLGLWFLRNGQSNLEDQGEDVLEIIAGSKPTLADRVFAQVSKVDRDAIEAVAISTKDRINHYGTVQTRLRELGYVRLLSSNRVDSGAFEIRFKAQ